MQKRDKEVRERDMIREERHGEMHVAGFEEGGQVTSQGRRTPPEAENSLPLTASQEMGTSVLEPHRTELCQQSLTPPE